MKTKRNLKIKIVSMFILAILSIATLAMPVLAAETPAPPPAPTFSTSAEPGSVASVVEDVANEVKSQAKVIVFNVVVWALIAGTIVFLIAKIVMAVLAYKQGAGFSLAPIIGAVVVLIVLLVLPGALWKLLG